MAESIEHVLQDLTRGRPFVFVIMAYNALWDFYGKIQSAVESETGLKCIRADEVPGSGLDLLEKVHLLIDRAELVLAEISSSSENVFYEVGYAIGKNRPLLFLASNDRVVPTDLKGRELIAHGQKRGEPEKFDRELREHLRARLGSRFGLMRDMLLAPKPTPAYIVASPRFPSERSQILGQRFDTRTFGDNVGIQGLLQVFGSIVGEEAGVELVSGQYCSPKLISPHYTSSIPLANPTNVEAIGPVSLYLLGSKKTNPPCGYMLDRIQSRYKRDQRRWYLGRIPKGDSGLYLPDADRKAEEAGDYRCRLYETVDGTCERRMGVMEDTGNSEVFHKSDFGVVIRSPHPDFLNSGRLVVILAGAHSLGTAAACLAATRSPTIRAIKDLLPKTHDFADKSRAFWALVKGTANTDGMLDTDGVEIMKADWYQ